MSLHKDRIAKLSRAKLALLAQRLMVDRQAMRPPVICRRAETGSRPPLSFGQQRLWFLHHLDPSSSLYNDPAAFRFKGKLEVSVVAQVLNEVNRRHEALRTTIAAIDAELVQVIAPPQWLALPIIDLTRLPGDRRQCETERCIDREARRRFDLSQGPLWRAGLIKLADDEHVLFITMHHIITDGWSTGILIQEVKTLYEAFRAGRPSPLAELAIQYADYAVWQREWMQGGVLEAKLQYWRKQLEGGKATRLPTDQLRPTEQTFRGAAWQFSLPSDLSAGLVELSKRESTTLFMTLLAAFKALLYRYTGQADIVVGTSVANRDHKELEDVIGFFVNTIALRTDLSGDPTFRELLCRVRDVALEGYTHQDFPFEKLVDAVVHERSLSHSPLFQVMFILQNLSLPDLELPGLTLSLLEVEKGMTEFDLVLTMTEGDQGLTGLIRYNPDLFEASRMSSLAWHYETLLRSIVSDADKPISSLRLLSETAGVSASDFPGLSQQDFEDLILEISKAAN
jgi:hypothetical protein